MRLSLLTILLCACMNRSPKAPEAKPPPLDCGAPLDFSWKAGDVVVFGELHGTQEIPAFVSRVACQAAKRGLPVRIGVEIPKEEQGRLDAFLTSDASPTAKAALVEGPFWHREFQDGRSSEAMLGLLEQTHRARQEGLIIGVFAFDSEKTQSQAERERSMAEEILAQQKRSPEALHLILVGNLHARVKAGAPWDPSLVWMSVYLSQSLPSLVTLNASYTGGEAWVCMGQTAQDCKVNQMKGAPPLAKELELSSTPDEDGYHGKFFVGEIHASRPAVSK